MAGDWIKVEENMPDKPEVHGMAHELGIEPDAVTGKLIRVWSWASRNCPVSGRTDVRSLSAIDRIAFMSGFAKSMEKAGWLVIEGDVVTFPNFDRHCSQTAKERSLDQKRKREKRQNLSGNCPENVRIETGQKPDQRREEKSNTPVVPKGTLQLRAEKLFNRRAETPHTRAEQRAFQGSRAAMEATTEEQWQALEAFYAAPQHLTYARKDLATLVNNWNGEIDRATAYATKGSTRASDPILTRV